MLHCQCCLRPSEYCEYRKTIQAFFNLRKNPIIVAVGTLNYRTVLMAVCDHFAKKEESHALGTV